MANVDMTHWECEAIGAINPNARWRAVGIDNITWLEDTTPISKADIQAKASELKTAHDTEIQAKIDLKASAKAKLIAGEALTEAEADTIIF